ncbi:hypothetical protein PG987_004899 [Apiospora arundinis]
MFRQRTSSQKLGDELLANFRQQFPEVFVGQQTPSEAPARSTTTADYPTVPDGIQLVENYCAPTPSGTNTTYHPQAGDLHTPTLGLWMGLGAPLSLPTSEGATHTDDAPSVDMAFTQHAPAQPSLVPSSCVHQNTGHGTMDHNGSSPDFGNPEECMGSLDAHSQPLSSPTMGFQPRHYGISMPHALPASAEKLRFHATLNAPTAMIKHADEIPVTYLNKGQAYSLSVTDTSSTVPIAPGTRYRTFVRISFEGEQQQQNPGVCWSLWKEGRGTNEAHQRGGKLQAVEYAEAGQPAEEDDKRTRVELSTALFDGFSVIWTPGIDGTAECNVAVRFNFLSTDFSPSKGVKGTPVRLCAKTVMLGPDGASPSSDADKEICYCKVKLFRDHGKERKFSNDIAHVKKSIDKMKQQIAQAGSSMKYFGKRKRCGASQTKEEGSQRPGKAPNRQRTYSMSSTSSTGAGGGVRPPLEEVLHSKLQTLQDMFTSTRPVSVLYLRGDEMDDPDLHPLALAEEPTVLATVESKDSWQARSGRGSAANSSLASRSPSSLSLQSTASVAGGPTSWEFQGTEFQSPGGRRMSVQAAKINKADESRNLSGWIEALGVDPAYKAPPELQAKPVACFYVARNDASRLNQTSLHRAVYLSKRTLEEFVGRVAAKWDFDADRIVRTVQVLGSGLKIQVDDDVVREMSEGQDMVLDVAEVEASAPPAETRVGDGC